MFPLLQHLDRGALQHIQRPVAEFGRVFAVVFQKCRNSSPIRDIESDGVSARNVRGLSVPISYPVRGICGTAFQFCLTKQLLRQNMLSVIACIVVLSFFFFAFTCFIQSQCQNIHVHFTFCGCFLFFLLLRRCWRAKQKWTIAVPVLNFVLFSKNILSPDECVKLSF